MRRLTARRLGELIGPESAALLMQEWGGHRLPLLPKFHVEHAERDRRIRALVDGGASYRAAAAEVTAAGFPCSRSQAERIASRP